MVRRRRSKAVAHRGHGLEVAGHRGQGGPLGHVGDVGGLVGLDVGGGPMTSGGPIIHPTRQPVMA